MDTRYRTLLVVGELRAVRMALAAAGVDGLVVPAGPGRTAIIPREDERGHVDLAQLVEIVSADAGFATLTNEVIDSKFVVMRGFQRGRLTPDYVSDQAARAEWLHNGQRADGVPSPSGPQGDEPAVFAPFGVDPIDLDRLGAALRGDFGGRTPGFAEFQHRLILKAMNLEPRGLTTAFDEARVEDLPGAVRIQKPGGSVDHRALVVLHVGLPASADPLEAAQIIVDAVVGGPTAMWAKIGYVSAIPDVLAADLFFAGSRKVVLAPQTATYFLVLNIEAGAELPPTPSTGCVPPPEMWGSARATSPMWDAALEVRYGVHPRAVMMCPDHMFQAGFRAAQAYRSSRAAT